MEGGTRNPGYTTSNGRSGALGLETRCGRDRKLPFDLVDHPTGFLRVEWRRLALAAFLGPSVSMDPVTGTMALDPRPLLASAAVLAGSVVISRCSRRREG